PEPAVNLAVGSGSHARQMGEMMRKLDPVLTEMQPDVVIVYGDTNSTLAGALVASKLNILTVHIEAGLRSFNRDMPEEINRLLTDHCTDLLLVPTDNALRNLRNEGFMNTFPENGIILRNHDWSFLQNVPYPIGINIGDIMYDAVLLALQKAEKKSTILKTLGLEPFRYYLATMHRAENTDDPKRLQSIWEALQELSRDMPVVFPLHPRTKKAMAQLNLKRKENKIFVIEPVGYLDMLMLQKGAYKILTDSGGMQKEAFFLKIPCITMRDETEWVETIELGCNVLVGAEKDKIIEHARERFVSAKDAFSDEPFGDGHSAERIYEILSHMI
ncbi:MAG: UDP-N-acetyl glucosamine 2-epimerase, partial [Candidatus Aminicenantes bacterium]|nr:UDP-N-acetyl glucosamine 2-epimerase [Candidatus Aminicenantes bacterium]